MVAWQSSDRSSRLPDDWQLRRAFVAQRAGGQCEGIMGDGTRCVEPGRECDHIERGDDHDITSARRSRSRVPTSRRCARPERHAGHRIQDSSRLPAGVGTPYPARPQHREMLSFFLCTGLGILRPRLSAAIATKYGTSAAWLGRL